jgi:hypothetical protein
MRNLERGTASALRGPMVKAELEAKRLSEGKHMSERLPPDGIEISPRFRRSIEERVERLERGADFDEQQLAQILNEDHLRRQRRLIAAQRAEALRMRIFLDRAATRLPAPLIELEKWDRQAGPAL